MYGSRKKWMVPYGVGLLFPKPDHGSGYQAPGTLLALAPAKLWTARPICLMLLEHCIRAAASRTFCTAGRRRPMRMAMIAITTNNSISVKPLRGIGGSFLGMGGGHEIEEKSVRDQ